jgi:hypothetical protein
MSKLIISEKQLTQIVITWDQDGNSDIRHVEHGNKKQINIK